MRRILFASLLFPVVTAAACELPFSETWSNGGTAVWSEGDEGCELESTLTHSDVTSAAVAHFRRRDPIAPFEMQFRVDLSQLTGINAIQGVSLAAGTAKQSPLTPLAAVADVFRLQAFGNVAGTSRVLGVFAACEGQPGNLCTASAPIKSEAPTLGIRWVPGGAGSGSFRVWVDVGMEGPPTISLDADNAAWTGIERITLGLSSPSAAFVQAFDGVPVSFDQIVVEDDQLLWADNENLGFAGCGESAAPLFTNTLMSGDTCEGTTQLPTIASGSTRTPQPERMYRFTVTDPLNAALIASGSLPVSLFVCPAACGPAAPCVAAGTASESPLTLSGLPAGDYIVAVKLGVGGTPDACGEYTLEVIGPVF